VVPLATAAPAPAAVAAPVSLNGGGLWQRAVVGAEKHDDGLACVVVFW
jgi:hypothetical protein